MQINKWNYILVSSACQLPLDHTTFLPLFKEIVILLLTNSFMSRSIFFNDFFFLILEKMFLFYIDFFLLERLFYIDVDITFSSIQ